MNFDNYGECKKSSMKRQYPPGGSSNFSLGWESDLQPIPQKTSSKGANFNIITGNYNSNGEVDVKFQNPQETTENKENYPSVNIIPFDDKNDYMKLSIKTDFKRSNFSLFNNDSNVSQDKPNSIKVTYAPGGKSSVLLGNDSTSYEEYRKKR